MSQKYHETKNNNNPKKNRNHHNMKQKLNIKKARRAKETFIDNLTNGEN